MSKESFYSSFYEKYVDDFDEYLDEVRTYLQYNNKKYINPQKEMDRLIDASRKLAKIISIYIDIQSIVEREMYFKGGAGAYDYFKKMKIIK